MCFFNCKKLKIYERNQIKLVDLKLKLYWGIILKTYTTVGIADFKIDLNFDSVLMNINSENCTAENNCEITSQTKNKDTYDDTTYEYQNAVTFLGYEKLSPGVIEDKDQIEYLKRFEVRLVEDTQPVKGKFPDFLFPSKRNKTELRFEKLSCLI